MRNTKLSFRQAQDSEFIEEQLKTKNLKTRGAYPSKVSLSETKGGEY